MPPKPRHSFKTASATLTKGKNIHASIAKPLKKAVAPSLGIKPRGEIKSLHVADLSRETQQFAAEKPIASSGLSGFKANSGKKEEKTIGVNTITPIEKIAEPTLGIRSPYETVSLKMSDQFLETRLIQEPIDDIKPEPAFGVTTNEVIQVLKPVKKLEIPMKRRLFGITKQTGKIVYITRTGEFYGFTGEEWSQFNTTLTVPTLNEILTNGNTGGGKSIVNIGILSGILSQSTTILATSVTATIATIDNLFVNNITTSSLSATIGDSLTVFSNDILTNNFQTTTLIYQNLAYNSIYINNLISTVPNINTNSLYITNLTTSTFSGTLIFNTLQVQNVTTATVQSSTIIAQNLITNTFTATLLNLNILQATGDTTISNNIVSQNIYNITSTIAGYNITFSNLFSNTLAVYQMYTNTFDASNLISKNVLSQNIVSTLAYVTTLYANIAFASTLYVSTFACSTLQVEHIYNINNVYSSTITSAQITGTTLNVNNFTSVGKITATLGNLDTIQTSTLSASILSFNELNANYLNVTNLSSTTLTLADLTASTIYGAKQIVVTSTFTATILQVTNVLLPPTVQMVNLTATIFTGESILTSGLAAQNMSTTTLSSESLQVTLFETYALTISSTFTSENIKAKQVFADNITSTLVSCFTLATKNINVSNVITNVANCNTFFQETVGTNLTASLFVGSTLLAVNIYSDVITATTCIGGTFTGTFQGYQRGVERIGFSTSTAISPNIINTFVTNGLKGKVDWGARVAGTGSDYGLGISINDLNETVATGYYNAQLTIYNAGGSNLGNTLPNTGGTNDVFIAKWNSSGITEWGARIAGITTGNEFGRKISLNNNGDSVVTGYYTNNAVNVYEAGGVTSKFQLAANGYQQAFVVKYDTTGNPEWGTRVEGTTANFNVAGYSVYQNNVGDIVCTGEYGNSTSAVGGLLNVYGPLGYTLAYTLPNIGYISSFIIKYASDGWPSWAAQVSTDSTYNTYCVDSVMNEAGETFITGFYNLRARFYNAGGITIQLALSGGSGYTDVFVAKYSSAGIVQWVSRLTSSSTVIANGISTNENGDIFVTGTYIALAGLLYCYGSNGNLQLTLPATNANSDIYVIKYNSAGAIQWGARIASAATDYSSKISANKFGNVFVTGYYNNASGITVYGAGGTLQQFSLPGAAVNQAFVVKYNSSGSSEWATRIGNATNCIGQDIDTNSLGKVSVTGYYSNQVLNFYQPLGLTIQYTLPPTTGGIDAFNVRYTDEAVECGLINPSTDGQIKKVMSTKPTTTVKTNSTLNYTNKQVQLQQNDSVELIWDAQQSNWLVINLTGTLV